MDRHPAHHPFRAQLALVLAILLCTALPAVAEDIEAKIEAAYLYHLSKFVDWPSLPGGDFRICILGSEAVGSMMRDLSGRKVKDRPLKIEVDAVADPTQCQILFIGRTDKRLPEILRLVRGTSVLTVSDLTDFARRGGMVGFYVDAGRIKLEINPDATRAANLRISAKLLEVARSIPSAPE